MPENPKDPELNAIESALGGLSPVPSRLDRDRLMFQSGALSRSRAERTRWIWPSAAAVLSLVVTGESIFLAARPARRVVERIVVIHEPSGPASTESTVTPPAPSPSPLVILSQTEDPEDAASTSSWETVSDYHRRQDLVLRFGLDAFPEPVRLSSQSSGPLDASEDGPMSAGVLRRIELEKLNPSGDHS